METIGAPVMRAASKEFQTHLDGVLKTIADEGLYKKERVITSQQYSNIEVDDDGERSDVINFCANNYLGLANHPALIAAGQNALEQYGFGMASVRFICGTQAVHRQLEKTIAGFFGFDDAILYAACFDANGGVFEPLLGADDAIISDALNHASIIDGIRLSKAARYRYANSDMADLETQLQAAVAAGAKVKMIATDGVFSMDGYIAKLDEICDLADKYGALVMVDDCHAAGFMGATGRGSIEHCGVMGRVDIVTGTLGKALGGAMGGFIVASQQVVDMMRQRSRPYLFSNSLAPVITAASIKAFELIENGDDLRARLFENAIRFRKGMGEAGFDLLPGEHPIIPVMLGDAKLAQQMAARLLDEGIYVVGFFFPVVPKGRARIRTQISAAHTPEMIDKAIAAFTKVGKEMGVI
jgi:glycine C-acetyltransferase